MARRTAQRSSDQDWLLEGLDLLREEGDHALTVEALCTRMGKTKGSFYHHFSGRGDFVVRLLEFWERTFTDRLIEDLEPLGDPRKRLRALGERTVREVDLRLERAIRLWGDREATARAVLERVDGARENYLREQFTAATGEPHRSLLAARAHLALLVGTQMLYQDLSREDLRELNRFAERLGFEREAETKKPREPEESS